eukprot:m.267184 g.267184  ORF g.267184 m.267184 type:complete len:54 (+) comp68939_c0_seq1:29-190(+)
MFAPPNVKQNTNTLAKAFSIVLMFLSYSKKKQQVDRGNSTYTMRLFCLFMTYA